MLASHDDFLCSPAGRRPLLLIFCLLSLLTCRAAFADASSQSVDIKSDPQWLETDLTVEAGKRYELRATGHWCGSDGVTCGPEGSCLKQLLTTLGPPPDQPNEVLQANYIGQNPRNALIARIGSENWTIFPSAANYFIAPLAGKLSFRINDDDIASTRRAGSMHITFSEAKQSLARDDGIIRISAKIDDHDFLHFTPDGIFWEWGGSWSKVGTNGGYYPTIINGTMWWPAWVDDKKTAPLGMLGLIPTNISNIRFLAFQAVRGDAKVEAAGSDDFVVRFTDNGMGSSIVSAAIRLGETISTVPKNPNAGADRPSRNTGKNSASVQVQFASGDTDLDTWQSGVKFATDQDFLVQRYPKELDGLTFTRRPWNHTSDATLDIPAGNTVYLILGAAGGAAKIRKIAEDAGWEKIGDVHIKGSSEASGLVYKCEVTEAKSLAFPGGGLFGLTVATKNLALSPSNTDKTPHPKPDTPLVNNSSDNTPIDISVPSAPAPATPTTLPAAPSDPTQIERPEFQNTPKPLLKSLTSITTMAVYIAPDGDETGTTGDLIATVPAESRRGATAGIGFARADGDDMMKTALDEAVRAITLRYPLWEPGHIDLSFGDKFEKHGGPSAGTACALLMLSILEGFNIDPKCAVTGDITVDWKVRKVGGVTAKLRGATLDKCLYAAIPEDNAEAFTDMGLLFGHSAYWKLQVFSIATLQDAQAIARKDRSPELTQAIQLFATLAKQLNQSEMTLHDPATKATLQKILTLAPNHLSAQNLLALADGSAAKTLSANATLYHLSTIFYPYRVLLQNNQHVDPDTLNQMTIRSRKQFNLIRPIANPDVKPLLTAMTSWLESQNDFAADRIDLDTLKSHNATLQAAFDNVYSDPQMIEKLVHEGY